MPTLLRTLTAERWRLLEHLRAHGPMSVNAAARGLQRNYKNVHGDVAKLVELGLAVKLADGRIRIPYRSTEDGGVAVRAAAGIFACYCLRIATGNKTLFQARRCMCADLQWLVCKYNVNNALAMTMRLSL